MSELFGGIGLIEAIAPKDRNRSREGPPIPSSGSFSIRRIVLPCGLPPLFVGLALLISLLLRPILPQGLTYIFLAAVVASGWFGGPAVGLYSCLLAATALDYFFVPPLYTLGMSRVAWPYVFPFLFSALAAAWMSATRKSLAAAKANSDLLAEMSSGLTQSENLQSGLKHSAEILVRGLDAVCAGIWILNPAENVLEFGAGAGSVALSDGVLGRIPVGQFEIGRVAERGEPRIDNKGACICEADCLHRNGVTAFAGHPARVGGHVVGVVAAFARHPFGAKANQILAATAGLAGQFIERRQAEASLRANENQFRELAENIREVFFVTTLDPVRVTYLSPTYEKVWGRPRQEVYEESTAWIKSIHGEDRAEVLRIFAKSQQGLPTEMEYRIIRPDGTLRWIRNRTYPVQGSEKRFCRMVGIAEDITERKQSTKEMALKCRLASLLAVVGVALANAATKRQGLQDCAEALVEGIDAAIVRIWTVNETENVLDLQASAGLYTHIYGGHAKLPIGKFKIGSIAECGEPHLSNSIAEDSWISDFEWARREGMVAFAGYPMKVEGRVVGVVAAFARKAIEADALQAFASVTDAMAQFIWRKRAEVQIQRLAAAVEQAAEMVVITDLDGTIQFVNPAFTRVTGYSAGEAVGQNARLLKSGKQDPAFYSDLWKTIRAGKVWRGELFNRRKNGTSYPEKMTVTPVRDARGDITNFIAIKEDVTDRKHVEEGLQRSEERARQLFAAIPHAAYVIDFETLEFLEVNDIAVERYGYTREEFLRMKVTEIRPAEEAERLAAYLQRDHSNREAAGEWKHVTKDGRIVNVEINYQTIDYGGRKAAITIAQDITHRKRAEEDLRFKTALLEAQSETAIDGILAVDGSDRIILANRRFARMFTIPDALLSSREDKLLIQYVSEQIEDAGAFVEKVKHLYRHPHEKSRDEIGLKDGRTLDRYSAPLIDASGRYCGRIWYFRDITERKRGEEEVYRSRQTLQSILDTIPQSVFWKDGNGQYLGCNQSFAIDAGLSTPDEIVGKADSDLAGPEFAKLHRADEKWVMKEGTAKLNFDESRTLADGRLAWLRVNRLPLRDRDGNVTGVITTSEDITERKRLEVELRQAQKLEAVGQLAAGIAHEINTPIQFVGDNTRFLRDAFTDLEKLILIFEKLGRAAVGKVDGQLLQALAEAQRQSDWNYLKCEIPKALDQTLDGVDRVARIVRAMKEFSHVDRTGQKAAGDLNRALESTLIVARNELKYVADVVTDFGEIPPVVCNLGELNQVFLNLLVNAAHAIDDVVHGSGKKGTIRVKTWPEGDQVVVAVGDTGTGIPEEIRRKIFEPFFTTKEVGRGSGQGLALARSVVVDRHAGSLTFETGIGEGTTFFVRLPVTPPPALQAGGTTS